jgi:hypothetical protein
MEFSHEKFNNEKDFNLDQSKQNSRPTLKEFSKSLEPKNYSGVAEQFKSEKIQEIFKNKIMGDYFQSRAREHNYGEEVYNTLNHIEYLYKELFMIDRKITSIAEFKDKEFTVTPKKEEFEEGDEWMHLLQKNEEPVIIKIPSLLPKDQDSQKYILTLNKRKELIFEEIKDILEIISRKYPEEYNLFKEQQKLLREENRTN